MSRAKSELMASLVAALTLVVFLAWYQGRTPAPEIAALATGQVERSGQVPEPAVVPTATTTVAVASPPSPSLAPQLLPPDVLARDRAFIDEAFPALSSWDVAEVKPLLSVAALAASTDAELALVMDTLEERLGTLQSFDAPQPVAAREELAREETSSTASLQPYRFTAYYEEGEAEVNLVLEKQPLHSALYSFDIHVPN
jgi:hypothetical protein